MVDSLHVTRMMQAAGAGDAASADALLPLVYQQLRAIAQQRMNSERGDHTLQATALVHEAYMKLVGSGAQVNWSSRGAFFKAAAEAMRRILIDHARAKLADKRGGGHAGAHVGGHVGGRMDLAIAGVADLASERNLEEIVALDAAFMRLQEVEPRAAEVVRLRFYAGLPVDDVAAALGVSPRTVDLDWSYARAWLYRALRHAE